MESTGIQLFKKVNVLLAVLCCCVFTLAIPAPLQAAPPTDAAQVKSIGLAVENPLVVYVGNVSCDPKDALLLERSLLTPVLLAWLQNLYPQNEVLAPTTRSFSASKDDCGLHTILTKGP